MIYVVVQRPPADKTGDEIVDELITSATAAQERGRNEIDETYTDRITVTASGPYLEEIRQNRLVEIVEDATVPWVGLITSSSITIDASEGGISMLSNLTIEKRAPVGFTVQ
jgi:hypothetical protein